MKMKNKIVRRAAFILIFALILIPILYEWFFLAGGFKRIFYTLTYDKDKIRVVEDVNFPVLQSGFEKEYNLDSDYYVNHRILLIPHSREIPADYVYDGEFSIELFNSSGELLNLQDIEKPISVLRPNCDKDYFGKYIIYVGVPPSKAGSVFAFEIGEIPFDIIRLKPNRLHNMKVKITAVKVDQNISQYCQEATLVIIPDLRM
jgi:hypothetical protein